MSTKKDFMDDVCKVVAEAVRDIVDMNCFDSKGKSIYEIRKKAQEKQKQAEKPESIENPYTVFLQKHASEIAKASKVSQADVAKNAQRIWAQMNEQLQNYYTDLYNNNNTESMDEEPPSIRRTFSHLV